MYRSVVNTQYKEIINDLIYRQKLLTVCGNEIIVNSDMLLRFIQTDIVEAISEIQKNNLLPKSIYCPLQGATYYGMQFKVSLDE